MKVMVIFVKKGKSEASTPRRRRAMTPEAREDQMIALAVDLAEKQLLEGTASAQVITHFLKLGSTKERLEKEMMEEQKKLLVAKTEAVKSAKVTEEIYREALAAMKTYQYGGSDESDN